MDIEYFYSTHSIYAYLGSRRLLDLSEATGRFIVHKPIDLDLVVSAAGAKPFLNRSKNHLSYYFRREIDRWAEERDVLILKGYPKHHFKDMKLANCFVIAAIMKGYNVNQLSHSMLKEHWLNDADLTDESILAVIANRVGLDAESLLELAFSQDIISTYSANSEEAITRSVFGSPTYFVDGDMFYGQDRLEMVERALKKPYSPS